MLDVLVEERMRGRAYTPDEAAYVAKVDLSAVKDPLSVSDRRLEKLRRLCQAWDIEIRPVNITSHRRIVGPLIVAAKKMIFPVLRLFLKDFIRRQKEFNAAAIALLAELSNERPVAALQEE